MGWIEQAIQNKRGEENMRIGVTGYRGNVGSILMNNYGFAPLTCNVWQPKEVEVAINDLKPNIILHLAGESNVNWCEQPKNQESVIMNNFRGSQVVFEQAEKHNIPVVYISSDHIFGGNGLGNYDENAKPNPKNFYGLSKVSVESLTKVYKNVHIIRTSTLFWRDSKSVSVLLADIRLNKDVYVPVYMWRSFLHIDLFCDLVKQYLTNFYDNSPEILNLSGSKVVSWYKFITAYAKAQGFNTDKIHPKYFQTEHDFAPRALRAGLNTDLSKRLGYSQYSYLDGLQ
jgi:dTDP-4-dehydrorhamnose reductase